MIADAATLIDYATETAIEETTSTATSVGGTAAATADATVTSDVEAMIADAAPSTIDPVGSLVDATDGTTEGPDPVAGAIVAAAADAASTVVSQDVPSVAPPGTISDVSGTVTAPATGIPAPAPVATSLTDSAADVPSSMIDAAEGTAADVASVDGASVGDDVATLFGTDGSPSGTATTNSGPGAEAARSTYEGHAASTASREAPHQGRARFSAAVARDEQRLGTTENASQCLVSDGVLCVLASNVDRPGSLVDSLASIIKFLAQTGLTLLPLIVVALLLNAAGVISLTAARRRSNAPPGTVAALGTDAWAYPLTGGTNDR
jgi:hypothetical protein